MSQFSHEFLSASSTPWVYESEAIGTAEKEVRCQEAWKGTGGAAIIQGHKHRLILLMILPGTLPLSASLLHFFFVYLFYGLRMAMQITIQ